MGCSITIIRDDIVQFKKLKLKRSNLPGLLTATGQRMNVSGKADVTVTTDSLTEKIDILVAQTLMKSCYWESNTDTFPKASQTQ